jgi:hypothetical protein
MSKRKINELNEIIDTAYVVADDSYDSRYDNNYNTRRGNTRQDDTSIESDTSKISFGHTSTTTQAPYRVGHTSNSTNIFRNNGGSSGTSGDGGNIFLKNKQYESINANGTTTTYVNNNKKDLDKVVLNDNNFPSLGSKPIHDVSHGKPNNLAHKLDFKKIVEKRPEVNSSKPEQKTANTGQYRKLNYNNYSLYQEVKEKSEHIARIKMVNDVLSDDDNIDNYDGY